MHIEEERYGDALLTTLPERLVRAGPLPGYPKIRALEPRGAVWIAVTLPDGQELQVINTHLGLIPQEQKKQATALVADWMADEKFTRPGILMGDFNATPFQQPYRICAAAIQDAQLLWPGAPMSTYPSGFPFMRIDHVFVSPGIKVTRVESPFDPESRKASDHLPLVVDVEIPPRA
jgi:endonuclease/exonuclease/phosphatase family metal-dependent hydrolase